MGSRHFGWVEPSRDRVQRLRFAGPKADGLLAGVDPAPSIDMSAIVRIVDQGPLGSCVAQACCQVIRAAMAAKTFDVDTEWPSRLWGYQLALAEQGTAGQDVGTANAIFFDVVAGHGFPRESAWPYEPGNLAQNPSPTAWRAAHDQRADKSVAYHQIANFGPARSADVRRALTAGYLVAFGTRVDGRFARGEIDAVVGPPSLTDTVGGHAMALCGYCDQPDGSTIYKVANSWGKDWGEAGFFWMSEAYLTSPMTNDLWIVSDCVTYSDVGAR